MNRMYEYRGYTLEVRVEAVSPVHAQRSMLAYRRYAAVVTFAAGVAPARAFATLRLDEAGGLPFSAEVDALMGGYSAAQRVIDEYLGAAQA